MQHSLPAVVASDLTFLRAYTGNVDVCSGDSVFEGGGRGGFWFRKGCSVVVPTGRGMTLNKPGFRCSSRLSSRVIEAGDRPGTRRVVSRRSAGLMCESGSFGERES